MIKLLEILWTFFKIGLFTIGGGYAMIPMIESEVMSKGWITETELVNFLAISESTPGPFAINIATFIGTKEAGVLGAIIATLGVVLPSFIIILIVFGIYKRVIKNDCVKASLNGIKAVVFGLILSVVLKLFYKEMVIEEASMWFNYKSFIIILIISTLMLVFKKKLHPILVIVIGAILGIITYGIVPMLF